MICQFNNHLTSTSYIYTKQLPANLVNVLFEQTTMSLMHMNARSRHTMSQKTNKQLSFNNTLSLENAFITIIYNKFH